jgi:hypothetical protein
MAHFAQLEPTNIPNVYSVLGVIVINNTELLDENGEENEDKGIQFCQNLTGHPYWKQTSYNKKFRGHYAGIGMIFDENLNAFFYPPHPSEEPFYKGWYFDYAQLAWQPPFHPPEVPYGKIPVWDNDTQNWKFEDDTSIPDNPNIDYW